MIGTTINRTYRLVRLLGQGGMGTVYEALHDGTGNRFAVKIIDHRLVVSSREAVRRFRREAKAASAIDSPHIVRVLDAGEDGTTGALYFVMECLAGEDLQRLIDRVGPLRPDAAFRIAAQALVGLARAHEAGIVHRDIKPANLFLAQHDGGEVTVKILDFGIAKVKADAIGAQHLTELTGTGDVLGSPFYISPEQAQSSRDIDHRTDLWSLGSALYCALTGQAPHQHVPALHAMILAICCSPARPLREHAPWVSPEQEQVVHGALEIEPDKRYPSAAAMLDAIQPLLPGGFAIDEPMLDGLPTEMPGAGRRAVSDAITEQPCSITWADVAVPRDNAAAPPDMHVAPLAKPPRVPR